VGIFGEVYSWSGTNAAKLSVIPAGVYLLRMGINLPRMPGDGEFRFDRLSNAWVHAVINFLIKSPAMGPCINAQGDG